MSVKQLGQEYICDLCGHKEIQESDAKKNKMRYFGMNVYYKQRDNYESWHVCEKCWPQPHEDMDQNLPPESMKKGFIKKIMEKFK